MRVLVIGATGTIGAAVVRSLKQNYEVIGVSRHGTPSVNLEDRPSIARLFRTVSDLDAVICCAGGTVFKALSELTAQDFEYSLQSKLMGQVELIRVALLHLKIGGSITVTSGALARHPVPGSGAISLVNSGLEGFVRAAALEAPRGIRVNVVSPPWVKETLEQMQLDPTPGLYARDVAKAYVEALEGPHKGATIDPATVLASAH